MNKEISIAIADLHGSLQPLETLLKKLQKSHHIFKNEDSLADHVTLTFLGDYVDRGQQSKEVLERVKSLSEKNPDRVRPLLGNHEAMALWFLDLIEELIVFGEAQQNPNLNLYLIYQTETPHGKHGGVEFIRCFEDRTKKDPFFQLNTLKAYHSALKPDAPLGKWMRELEPFHLQEIHGKKLLHVHAGIPIHIAREGSLDSEGRQIKEKLTALPKKEEAIDELFHPLMGSESLIWTRSNPNFGMVETKIIADEIGADFIIIGHTSLEGKVGNYGNRIFNIDVGMSDAYGAHQPTAFFFDEKGPQIYRATTGLFPLIQTQVSKNHDDHDQSPVR